MAEGDNSGVPVLHLLNALGYVEGGEEVSEDGAVK